MEELLKEGEGIEDLQVCGFRLIQNEAHYRFTADAVYLADFARVKRGECVADFGTGSGVVLLLLAAKHKELGFGYGVEVQEYLAGLCERNIRLNRMEGKLAVLRGRIQDMPQVMAAAPPDVIVCNPPYRAVGRGERSGREEIAVCRHEVLLTLSELLASCGSVLKRGGRLYLVHLAQRLGEVVCGMYANQITPKRLRFVQAKPDSSPRLVLVEGVKGGGEGMKVDPPLVVMDAENRYTAEIERIYGREEK